MKNNTPLISVIIPVYNHERYVQETILSIINQTYKNIEILIIDDGSSDSSYDKICEMEEQCNSRFVRYEIRKQENKGIIETLNSLIDMSYGEYIYVIASDDVAVPQAVEAELDFLVNNPDYALCVGLNDIIDENSRKCYWDENRKNVYSISEAKYFSFTDFLMKNIPELDFFSNDFGLYPNFFRIGNHIPNGYLIRKSILKKTGLYVKDAPLEDLYMNMQIAKHSKMKLLNQTLFNYRWHEANTSQNPLYNNTINTLLYEIREYLLLINEFSRLNNEINNLKTRISELERRFLDRVARKLMKGIRKLF